MAALMKCISFFPSSIYSSLLVRSVVKPGSILENKGLFNPVHLKQIRQSSFLQHLTAEKLWKGVTSVSAHGKRKGQGKRVIKDLNKGQVIGVGKVNMMWPGLNSPIIKGKEVFERQSLPPNLNRETELLQLRGKQSSFRRLKLDPLERGFSGVKWPGRSCGPPESKKEGAFQGFDSKVLELRSRSVMGGKFGRQRQVTALVVTGNMNGLAGFAMVKSKEGASAIRQAKNLAGSTLRYFDRFEGHTVFHDFYSSYNASELYVKKRPKGYGLRCNRVIKILCEMIGITDLFVRIEGSNNPLMITSAFFMGLKQQKTHQELADMMGLNVVEFKSECDDYPRLIAAPRTRCRSREEISTNEITDFDEFVGEGRLEKPYEKRPPPTLKSYWKGVKKRLYQRNHNDVRFRLLAKHGSLKSFYHLNEERRLEEEKLQEVKE